MGRRALPLALAAVAALAALPRAGAREAEVRWVVSVRATGALEVVRSDGTGRATLAEDGIVRADLGPSGLVLAVREEGPTDRTLVRLSVAGGASVPLAAGDPTVAAVAVSGSGDVALLRFARRTSPPPAHLRGSLRILARARLPVLVPPDRPPGTTGLVADADRRFYRLLFTNDPTGELSHAEQVNRLVAGTRDPLPPPPEAAQVAVRGTTGAFVCGASACFLDWREGPASYSVGEFGRPADAVAFAESLVPLHQLAPDGATGALGVPQLVVLRGEEERVLASADGACECSIEPVGWDDVGRVLAIFEAEGETTLLAYGAEGEPTTVADPPGRLLDAALGPDGVVVLVAEGQGGVGSLESLDGERLAEDVRAFDIEGSTLALVAADGSVVVRDLASGRERTVAEGAVDVSLGPDLIPGPPAGASPSPGPGVAPGSTPSPTPPPGDGSPVALVGIAAGAGALVLLAAALRSRARRR